MINFEKLPRIHRNSILTLPLGIAAVFGAFGAGELIHAALWSAQIDFNEFEGSSGGFENEGFGTYLYQNRTNGEAARTYDVLAPTGTVDGRTLYAEGQDGQADLQIRTQVLDSSGGRWSNLEAEKRRDALRTDVQVLNSTSVSGDHAVIMYEFTFKNGLSVNARDFAVRLASANGHGELYEWTFVTIGGIEDAPFDINQLDAYRPTDYSNLTNSAYFNTDGTARAGATSTDGRLDCGASMSQFLAGQPAADATGGNVQRGWYAIDDWNSLVRDGEEDFISNPEAGIGRLPIDQTVTGAMMGYGEDEMITKFTVWFGYYDVGFDTNGDGFTSTNSNQEASVRTLSLGGSVPEPGPSIMAFAAAIGFALQRRRR